MLTPMRFHRLRAGLIQIQLAQQVGLPTSKISLIERGIIDGKPDEMRRIAGVLGVPIRELEPKVTSSGAAGIERSLPTGDCD